MNNLSEIIETRLIIRENIPLAPLTTLKIGGPARYFVEAASEAEVKAAVAHASAQGLPLFVMGGGSNLVVADEGWPGLVLRIAIRGAIKDVRARHTNFTAGAGEPWDSIVEHAVHENCGGIECLSGIPGTVGGTPIQNVGAYGQEVAETITSVRVLQIATGEILDLNNSDCAFGYRSSVFNGNQNSSQRGRSIVLKVTFQLANNGRPRIEYADLKRHFAGSSGTPTLRQVREAVMAIRRTKAMLIVEGDEDCRSAGSFFKNPVVSHEEADRVQAIAQQRAPEASMPRYRAENNMVKLSAAWLVEQSGFHKGYTLGPVGISRKHSLAIVNRGGATARDILALKNQIQQRVIDVWGVQLQVEPVFVGIGFM
ncbi:MAG: UDP-N-acetylmuramate dehydrogenase [Acidobacteriia bacterium]|nr:UDP-N-acetylmuramate dehydrogenase [Terriglobia bacterium]